MEAKREENRQNEKKLDSNQEASINEAYLTNTIQALSIKAIFWRPFVYVLFKNIKRSEIYICSRINLHISRIL